jgi:hypothetical protein
MNIKIDTALFITDNSAIGLFTSSDSFERAIEERTMCDMVEEYCKLFELPGLPHVISSDCYDLVGGLRAELLKALEVVDRYVDATAQDILNCPGEYDGTK